MIYVPMLKTRREEMSVLRKMRGCFSDEIIPLVEILNNKYETKYEIDPITKDYIFEQRGKSRRRKKRAPTDDDIITLDYLNNIIDNKLVFVDFFRFAINKYGKSIAIDKVELAWKLSNDFELYKRFVRGISRFENMIPVISIKEGFGISVKELEIFLMELQKENVSIALRITEEYVDEYEYVIRSLLRNSDYLLLDICEQNPKSKFIELEEILKMELNVRVILLNSPRKISIRNGEYDTHGITKLINNCAKDIALEYSLEGYGDYCGLKDDLPSNRGSNGRGAAIALLYDYTINSFYSYVHPDTSYGVRGYKEIIPTIITDKRILDAKDDCPAFEKIMNMDGPGTWSTWNNINATRYIYQVFKHK